MASTSRSRRTKTSVSERTRVVFPVPPFCDRTAIAADIGRTIWPCASVYFRSVLFPQSRARSKKAWIPGGEHVRPSKSHVAVAPAAPPFARAGLSPPGSAAERGGSGCVRHLCVGAEGRDRQPSAGGARAREPPEDAPSSRERR